MIVVKIDIPKILFNTILIFKFCEKIKTLIIKKLANLSTS